jgi:hypothetical protein
MPAVTDPSVLHLARLAARRWGIVTRTLFLAHACDEVQKVKPPADLQRLSVVGTLAAFAMSDTGPVTLVDEFAPLQRLLLGSEAPYAIRDVPGTAHREKALMSDDLVREAFLSGPEMLSLFLLSPDPLELLIRRAVGIPDHLTVRGVH